VAIEEGHAAAAVVHRVRQQLQAAFAAASPGTCTRICDETLRSLEYQETLFDALAAWRQAFLSYYRWLDTGDAGAWNAWRDGRKRFEIAATQHVARFGRDLDFPAFDLTSATRAVTAAERGARARLFAAGLLIGVVALLGIGSPLAQGWGRLARFGALSRVGRLTWTTAVTPWRLGREPVDPVASVVVTLLALVLIGLLVDTLTGFTAAWIGVGSSLLFGVVALAFESSAIGVAGRRERGRFLVASVGPLIPGVIALFALIAYVGPVGFWYWFWTSPSFRVASVTILLAMLLWTAYVMLATRNLDGWHGRVGGALAAAGAGLVALTFMLPDWVDVFRSLDRPLNLAPATDTMLFALQVYAGVSLDIGRSSLALGAVLLSGGYAISWRSVVRGVSDVSKS
jgi:hypothetical protein